MSIKKARKTLQNKEKFNYDILDKVANSGGIAPKGEGILQRNFGQKKTCQAFLKMSQKTFNISPESIGAFVGMGFCAVIIKILTA